MRILSISDQKRKYSQWDEADIEREIAAYHNADMGLPKPFVRIWASQKDFKRRFKWLMCLCHRGKKGFNRTRKSTSRAHNVVGKDVFGLTVEYLKRISL